MLATHILHYTDYSSLNILISHCSFSHRHGDSPWPFPLIHPDDRLCGENNNNNDSRLVQCACVDVLSHSGDESVCLISLPSPSPLSLRLSPLLLFIFHLSQCLSVCSFVPFYFLFYLRYKLFLFFHDFVVQQL